mmetsp:Transcript_32662/g.31875  ORF Transcript_32662/g.31875 Transcript_32662/m.31875 type:complete len:118 (-) Transcript_32662:81-434(-)
MKEKQILMQMTKRLSLSEFAQPQTLRKDIYPYIKDLVGHLVLIAAHSPPIKQLLESCEPNWTALRKVMEEEETSFKFQWGQKELPAQMVPRKEDVVRKHEPQAEGIQLTEESSKRVI